MKHSEQQSLLRRDKVTGFAIFSCMLALGLSAVGLVTLFAEGPQVEARGNPLYWLILLVPASWVWWVQDYSPRALRTVRPLLFAAPFIAGGVLALASQVRDDGVTQYLVMLVLVCLLTLTGGVLYDSSVLAREGPGD